MRGIIYFNRGTKCRIRLLVSLYSLRKHYAGPVAVLIDSGDDEWFVSELLRLDAQIVDIPRGDNAALAAKSTMWKWTPFATSLFLDADTLVMADPSPLFDEIEKTGIMTYHFADWSTTGRKISKRIRAWKPATSEHDVNQALAYGPAVNTGIHGYVRGHPFLADWESLTHRGYAKNCTRRLVDELAWQMLLHRHPCTVVGPEWGASVKFWDVGSAKIIHYHGSKHTLDLPACDPWKQTYREYRDGSPAAVELGKAGGDRRFRRWLAADLPPNPLRRENLTIVTAVNPGYAAKLAANWPLWMQDPEIAAQRFILFVNRRPKLPWAETPPNVTIVPWKFDAAGDNIRERMLSAFVFGVAEHVQTDYWMKLDCDATPTGVAWEWPDYENFAITGHRCGRTVTKGQVDPPKHFLNQLDDWWWQVRFNDGDHEAIFPEIEGRGHGHKRTASYCCIERTAFTQDLAATCNNMGGRLPVPSQDTTAWYVAHRTEQPIRRMNMRKWFSP